MIMVFFCLLFFIVYFFNVFLNDLLIVMNFCVSWLGWVILIILFIEFVGGGFFLLLFGIFFVCIIIYLF